MQNLMVVLDGSEQSWQAAFLAYDLGVRGGTRLVGAVPANLADAPAAQLLAEFRTGAQAAGVRFRTSRVRLTDLILHPEDRIGLTGLLVGGSGLRHDHDLATLVGSALLPLWVVPHFRDLRRAVVLHNTARPVRHLAATAASAARTWGWALEEWWLGASPGMPGRVQTSPEDLLRPSAESPADLWIVAWPPGEVPVWDLYRRFDRPLLIVPSP